VKLEALGLAPAHTAALQALTSPALRPARVSAVHARQYRLLTGDGEIAAAVSGHFRDAALSPADFPTVGDWVTFTETSPGEGVIHDLLPRTSCLTRKAAGRRSDLQPLAANVDRVLIVMGLDGDYKLRRLERALVMVQQSGASAVVVLNKSDLDADVAARRHAETVAIAGEVPVVAVSALQGEGLDGLDVYLQPAQTLVLLGSSGAGKSTLVNRLLSSARQTTGPVREHDDRGRHTTTTRELVVLPSGALLIDTPGIREIQLTASPHALDAAFDEVAAAARSCRFRDCRHEQEPGCAVRAAVDAGQIAPDRVASLRKLERELAHQAVRDDALLERERKAKWKAIHKAQRHNRPRE
jgi:ribosome biogenesis GTPase